MPQCKQQRVFVGMDVGMNVEEEHRGVEEKKSNGGLKFKVYNQGILKMELCNKWEETVAYPYGNQFAHGTELRPIRF